MNFPCWVPGAVAVGLSLGSGSAQAGPMPLASLKAPVAAQDVQFYFSYDEPPPSINDERPPWPYSYAPPRGYRPAPPPHFGPPRPAYREREATRSNRRPQGATPREQTRPRSWGS
jgi:hypothetical protein